MIRRTTSHTLLLAIVVGTLTAVITGASASAAPPEPFDPGDIISDEVFFDSGAMSASEVQSFLNSKVTTCKSGYTCLKDYRQDTPSKSADAYCGAYQGKANESAATIITKVSRACGISPEVILVTLQKEQGLVTHVWPSDWRFDKAMGFGCPDTAACDPTYGGFFYQIYYGARQFQRYAQAPTRYNYQVGRTNNILFHPSASCGSKAVYISNQATAGLYNYTPYQPNAAALANLYGTGDSCSSYGNRNFWRYFWEWFGDPTLSSTLIKATGDNRIFLVADGVRYHVTDWSTYQELKVLGSFVEVSPTYLDLYTDGGAVTRLFTNDAGHISLLDRGSLHHFPTCSDMKNFGYPTCGGPGVVLLTDAQYGAFSEGTPIRDVVTTTQGAYFSITDKTLTEYLSNQDRRAAGFGSTAAVLEPARLDLLEVGEPSLPETARITDSSTGGTYLTVGAAAFKGDLSILPSSAAPATGKLTSASIAKLTVSDTQLQTVMLNGSTPVWLSPAGSTTLPVARLADIDSLPVLPEELASIWPDNGTLADGLLIKAPNANPVYLVTPDGIRHVTSWSLAQQLAGTKSPTLTPVSPQLIAAHRDNGALYMPGTLVKTSDSNRLYYISSDTSRNWLPSFTLSSAAGVAKQWKVVAPGSLDAYTVSEQDFSDGFMCADTLYVAGGRSVHQVPASLTAEYPVASITLDAATCATLTIGKPAGKFIHVPSGKVYLLEDGVKRHVATWARWLEIKDGRSWLDVTDYLADAIPDGPAA